VARELKGMNADTELCIERFGSQGLHELKDEVLAIYGRYMPTAQ
jgi:hypothetical protein